MEFPLTSTTSGPTSIAPGQTYPSVSDSNVWIAETAANDLIAVSPYGAISQTVTLPGGTNPMFLAQLWSQSASTCCIAYQWMILEPASSGIAVVTPGSAALPTQISPPTVGAVLSGSASGIGPSGLAVWFSESNVNKVAELGTSDPTYPVATEFTLPTANAGPTVMGQGSDGNMWVYESLTNKLAQISSAGVITEYPLLSAKAGVSAISAAAGKTSPYAIYIAETTANKIASVTTTGAIVEYPIPVAKSGVNALTVDTSGNVWFTEPGVNMIGEMSPSGAFSPGYTVPTSNAGLAGISLGNRGTTTLQQECCADNRIWFTEQTAGKVGVYSQ